MLRQRYVQSLIFTKDFYFRIHLSRKVLSAPMEMHISWLRYLISHLPLLCFSRERQITVDWNGSHLSLSLFNRDERNFQIITNP